MLAPIIPDQFCGRPGDVDPHALASLQSFSAAGCLDGGTFISVSVDGLEVAAPGLFGVVPRRPRDDRPWLPGDSVPVLCAGRVCALRRGADGSRGAGVLLSSSG